jgi:3-hydroxyisobutyrate dehydrogenase-like beta-hydroxyacid dehydrogenase
MTIAFLGLGKMGSPMAANLVGAGHDVVGYNRTQEKADAWARQSGGSVAATPAAAAAGAEVVIAMLADADSVRAVFTGDDGVLGALPTDAIVVDMGTTGPEGVAWLDDAVSAAGGTLVDAPVSGSTAAATSAGLTILAGGPDTAVATVRPLFEAMGSQIYHLGATGAGAAMKLAVNAIIYAIGQSVSEALVLAERAGIARELAYDVFENSAVAAPMVKYRHDAFLYPEETPAAFALRLAAKDLRLITALADDVGAPMPQAEVNLSVAAAAVAAGFADDDMSAVARYLRSQGGVAS